MARGKGSTERHKRACRPKRRTSYWLGRVMGHYTTQYGVHVTVCIHDDGGYALHGEKGKIAIVKPIGEKIEVMYCIVGRAFSPEAFTKWRDANEAAKLWAEGFSTRPIETWYPQADEYYTAVEGGSLHAIATGRLADWREGFIAEHVGEYVTGE